MKIRSKQLWQYLQDAGVLNSGEAAIREAKISYRRAYKRRHRKNCARNKEIRITFTKPEFEALVGRSKLYGLSSPTAYARELVLTSQENREFIPNKAELLNVLQAIGMSATAFTKDSASIEALALLIKAEELLMHYLSIASRDDH